MKFVYALLLSMFGLICILCNRFAVEETMRMPRFGLPWPPVWFSRIIVIVAGLFFVVFGLLMMGDYLQ